ncbi:MAG TPA: amidohydrolase [Bacteroidales bacterium]|nr:amidohydrolase [Bacteroidales bacterium]
MKPTEVDLILFNGHVYTVDSTFSVAASFAVKDGKFVAVGTNEEIARRYQSAHLIDAGGKAVYPGFNDGHCHFYGFGENLFRYAELAGAASFAEVIDRLKQHAASHPSEWLLGRGWDQNLWEGRQFPTNEALEEVFPNKKILLLRIDGHASLVSKAALELAGISAKTQIEGGEVLLGKDGKPTGVLIDNADAPVKALVPKLTDDEKKTALLEAQKRCFAFGLTSVTDAGLPYATIRLIEELQSQGTLKMKVNAMIDPDEETMNHYLPSGPYSSGMLSVRSVKLYADGALGSRGAKMKAPYSDAPDKSGLIMHETSFYQNVIQRAYDAGFQVNTHAIGDSGVSMMLGLYGAVLKGSNDRRWRIEHAQVVDEVDFARFATYNIIPSIQSTHATSDMGWAAERVGNDRVKGAYAQKRLLSANGWLVNGTDFPIENINPVYTFYAAVFRKDLNGKPAEGFQMENALSREEALRSITIWPAKGAFEEIRKGSIEPSKAADFVILSADLMKAAESEIVGAVPLQVFSNGKQVFSKAD